MGVCVRESAVRMQALIESEKERKKERERECVCVIERAAHM